MERFTVSIDEELIAAFDAFIACKGYDNRSEAIRDLIREKLHADRLSKPDSGECVACLSYVYDHNERRLASRVVEAHHHHHDLSRATTRVQLDHHDCMEVTILEGSIEFRHLLRGRIDGGEGRASRGVEHRPYGPDRRRAQACAEWRAACSSQAGDIADLVAPDIRPPGRRRLARRPPRRRDPRRTPSRRAGVYAGARRAARRDRGGVAAHGLGHRATPAAIGELTSRKNSAGGRAIMRAAWAAGLSAAGGRAGALFVRRVSFGEVAVPEVLSRRVRRFLLGWLDRRQAVGISSIPCRL